MKNIYDLLNQAEDNEDILSENERMEMTDIEKRRIYNRILLDSEEEQEEQSCNEQKKYQDNEKAQQVEGGRNIESEDHKNRQEQAKKGRKAKKLLTAAACMAVICAVGFTAGAAVKEYLYKNTQYALQIYSREYRSVPYRTLLLCRHQFRGLLHLHSHINIPTLFSTENGSNIAKSLSLYKVHLHIYLLPVQRAIALPAALSESICPNS